VARSARAGVLRGHQSFRRHDFLARTAVVDLVSLGVLVELALLDERRFGNGVVHLHYRTRT
jgi:hypothetical protein